MKKILIQNNHFEKLDCMETPLQMGDYEDCTFLNCSFHQFDLSNFSFEKCTFNGCDFSLSKLNNTVLIDIRFLNCKLLGLHFDDCSDFILTVYFENCILKLSSFYKLPLRKTKFIKCNLQDVDFTEANLCEALFEDCDLQHAIFEYTKLENADFYTSWYYSIDPDRNKLKKARFSKAGVVGLLDKYDLKIED